ncbi:MAG: 1,4-dihydroxy-2-naphthoate polyprenyltransferase [Acidimicrobiales bacterium]
MTTNRWVLGARPRTLPAAVVPVAVGTAAAVGVAEGGIIWWRAVAAMVVSLALQIATNYVNDYADGDRGTDDARVGPVRLVASGLATSGEVKRAAAAAFAVAGIVGGALAVAVGPELFVVGAASILAGWAYTGGPKPYGYLGLGEVFVFVFFGLVATVGSTYVQTESITELSVVAAVPVGLLSVALLVVNNLRDIPGDTVSGKQTLAVRMGDPATRNLYLALFALVGVFILVAAVDRPPAAIALVGLLLAAAPIRAVREGALGPALIPVLGMTGKAQLAIGALFAVGLAIGG